MKDIDVERRKKIIIKLLYNRLRFGLGEFSNTFELQFPWFV